ncbi:hypothetical protein BJX65DRAFT_209457 [Aspergillus insuetus]
MIVKVAWKDNAKVGWIRGGRYIFLSGPVQWQSCFNMRHDRAFISANMAAYLLLWLLFPIIIIISTQTVPSTIILHRNPHTDPIALPHPSS